jgi:hypothetical protein
MYLSKPMSNSTFISTFLANSIITTVQRTQSASLLTRPRMHRCLVLLSLVFGRDGRRELWVSGLDSRKDTHMFSLVLVLPHSPKHIKYTKSFASVLTGIHSLCNARSSVVTPLTSLNVLFFLYPCK